MSVVRHPHAVDSDIVAGAPGLPSRTGRSARFILLAAVIALPVGPSAHAQAFGQWWWVGQAGLAGIYRANLQDNETLNRYQRTGLLVDAELNGYALHPAVAQFRVGLEALVAQTDGSRFKRDDRLGGLVELKLLPRSRFPGRLFAQHRSFGYEPARDSLSVVETEVPESATTMAGTWSLRRTLLGSVTVNANRTTTRFFLPDTDDALSDHQNLNWSYSKNTFRHVLVLRRWQYESGTVDYTRDGITAVLNESGTMGDRWRWYITGSALDSGASYSAREYDQQQYRGLGRFTRSFRRNDLLQLRASGSLYDSSASELRSEQSLRLSYLHVLTPAISLQPYVSYSGARSDGRSRSRPSFGLGTTWSKAWGAWRSILTASAGYGRGRSRSDDTVNSESSGLSFTLGETIVHRRRTTKELQLTVARDDDILETLSPEDLPAFGLPRVTGQSDEVYSRASLTLPHSLGTLRAWGDYNYRRSRGALLGGEATQQSSQAALDSSFGRFSLGFAGGYSMFEREGSSRQEVGHARLQGSWRPTSFLTVRASHQLSRRFPEFGPHADGSRTSLGLLLSAGRFRMEIRGLEQREELVLTPAFEMSSRSNRLVTVNIVRSLGGLLPIISAPHRNGRIR